MYCSMTNGHCMLCLRHDTRPRPRGNKSMTGDGVPLIGLPPQQLHSHHTTDEQSKFSLYFLSVVGVISHWGEENFVG